MPKENYDYGSSVISTDLKYEFKDNALKNRGYIWYSGKKCFICKPEKFDLEWAKNISERYEKYL